MAVSCASRGLDGERDAFVVLSRRTRLSGFTGLEIMTETRRIALGEDLGRDFKSAGSE